MDGITSVHEATFNNLENHFKSVNFVILVIENARLLSIISYNAYVLGIPFNEKGGETICLGLWKF